VHINHGLRGPESDADQVFVEELCARLGVPLHVHPVATAAYADTKGETIEEAARHLRLAAFQALLASGAATHILTAHTLDDQAETVLMKLLRGAWLEGLGGIAPVLTLPPGKLLRPLLTLRRAELRGYLEARGQSWREDASNSDEAFTRNRLRHRVLPVLRGENPQVDLVLANLAELARDEEARWAAELEKTLPHLLLPGKPVRGGGRSSSTAPGEHVLALELERLRGLDPALRRRVLRAAARQLGVRLSFAETTQLLTLAGLAPGGLADPTVPVKPGANLKLAQGLVAERSLRELRLARVIPPG
jgi:tRNA(Ile)-lysidine synthase